MTRRPPTFDRSFGFILSDISRLARKEFDRRVASLRLTRSQWLFLYHLARQPGCTQSELAESLQMERISVSRQADRLERAGWIERRDHRRDGRAYHLHPTTKARRMTERLDDAAAELRRDYLRGVPVSRQVALRDDLISIKNNLQAMEASVRPTQSLS